MKGLILFVFGVILPPLNTSFAQVDIQIRIQYIDNQIKKLDSTRSALEKEKEELKLAQVRFLLKEIGLPSNNYIEHSAMFLEYSEPHEQAKWVFHMITPDITTGEVFRTNDFRIDPKVETGTAKEEDYFLKYLQPDSTYEYDGFGFDRGHLAPSADFRWSRTALSESYYYSNMSPQKPEFNREAWADLESQIRSYVIANQVPVYVLTAPVFSEELLYVERSTNRLAIPDKFIKIVLDLENQRGVGFILPHEKIDYPLSHYARAIDEVETFIGLDLFANLPDNLESQIEINLNKSDWFPELAFGEAEPLVQEKLPSGYFNTVVGARYLGTSEEIRVCGKVVSSRYSRAGHLWLNLDKNFPDQIFSIFIRKEDFVNFPYDPKLYLTDQIVCFEGKVEEYNGTATINVEKEKQVGFLE